MRGPLSSSTPRCRVRNLRLRANSAAEAQRSATTLGDALHTASFPGETSGRVLAIRRLALGRIRPTNTPGTLALSVERAVRESIAGAVWFDVPEARHANVVAFPNRCAALVALAHRLASHSDTTAWFWDQIVPSWNRLPNRDARWRSLLAAAHEGDAAVATAAAVVAEVVRTGPEAGAEILAAVSTSDAEFWLFALGFSPTRSNGVSEKPSSASEVHLDALERALASSGLDVVLREVTARTESAERPQPESKLIWMATLLALEARPAWSGQPDLPAQITTGLQRWTNVPRDATARRGARTERAASNSATTDAVEPRDAASADSEQNIPVDDAAKTPASSPREATGEISAFAGLLFLVPVLQRLGFPQRTERERRLLDEAFAARLLLYVGCRVGMPLDDPLTLALTARVAREAANAPEGSSTANSDAAWRDAQLTSWFAAVRTWLRRRGPLTVSDLVQRRGRVEATRTHFDLCFEPAQADVRLRRLALDVDPGWVPWLGCVLRFHYETSHERRD